MTINYGAQSVRRRASRVGSAPIDVTTTIGGSDEITLTVPAGVASGPQSVTTLGGTSAPLGLTFTGIVATATTGTPAGSAASANPGQSIMLSGSGFSTSTDVVFPVIDDSGTVSELVVVPTSVSTDKKTLTVTVPVNAETGVIQVIGDSLGTQALLQVIPVITGVDVTSVASNGGSINLVLHGSGFIEGNNSVYGFGTVTMTDNSIDTTEVDVTSTSQANDTATLLAVPLSASFYGGITVTTAGGTSTPLTVTYMGITATPTTGTRRLSRRRPQPIPASPTS